MREFKGQIGKPYVMTNVLIFHLSFGKDVSEEPDRYLFAKFENFLGE
jgi:hypothetical protein